MKLYQDMRCAYEVVVLIFTLAFVTGKIQDIILVRTTQHAMIVQHIQDL